MRLKQQNYSQPNFYHFSDDSTGFAYFLSKYLPFRSGAYSIVDLFSGCGVIGIELCMRRDDIKEVSFIEQQKVYEEHLRSNISHFLPGRQTHLIIADIFQLAELPKGSVYLFNPPFYAESEGRKPELKEKEKCHFIKQNHFDLLLKKLIELDEEIFFILPCRGQLITRSKYRGFFKEIFCLSQKVSVFTTEVKSR